MIRKALSIAEATKESGVGRSKIFDEIQQGRLIARKCGRRTLILDEDFARWLRALPLARKSASEMDSAISEQ